MLPYSPQAISGYNITATNVAATIFSLIEAASAGSIAVFPGDLDAILIMPETLDVRITFNSKTVPTSSNGWLLKAGGVYYFPRFAISGMQIISVSGSNAICSVMVGKAESHETVTMSTASMVTIENMNVGQNIAQVAGANVVPTFTGVLPVSEVTASTGTHTDVTSSGTTGTILAANALRKGATFFNESAAILYLNLGTAASTTKYTIQMGAGSYYEIPFDYQGIITGIWASANGFCRVTELT